MREGLVDEYRLQVCPVVLGRGKRLFEGRPRDAVADGRDVYAYGHLLMIVGIGLFAFAMKPIVGHVGQELDSVAAFALFGGSALYLLSYSALRSRSSGG
jgi:low temperature requirement protein LtrA